jgi:hypothetical protein
MGDRGKIPIYGFVAGDVLGVLVLADLDASAGALAEQVLQAAAPRVRPFQAPQLVWQGSRLDRDRTLRQCGLVPLSRVDVVRPGDSHGT